MQLRLLVFVILALPSISFASDLRGELKSCAELQDKGKRLECYDRLAASAKQAEANPTASGQSPAIGRWKLTRETSPIDDSQIVYLSLAASQTMPAVPGRTDPTLFIRCKDRQIESFLNWGVPVGTRDIDITTRFGTEEAETKRWTLSTDFTSTFIRGSHSAFVAKLRTHNRFTARLLPIYRNETTAIFDLSGLNEVIGDVLVACNQEQAHPGDG